MSDRTKTFVRNSSSKTILPSKPSFPVFLKEGEQVEGEQGKYMILRKLGNRGESYVYLSDDITNNKKVVVKLYYENFCPKEDIINILLRVKHKNIMNVLDIGYCENQYFEVMEYAEGGALSEILKEGLFFTEEELKNKVIPEVVNGLKFCHSKGIIHKDIKPENIFYMDKTRKKIVIGDFGISTQLENGLSIQRTRIVLTPIYSSPEAFTGYIGKETDYYSLGISLLYLLGHEPFLDSKDNAEYIMYRHVAGKKDEFIPDLLSDNFKNLLRGLLTKEREKRWGSDHIERWLKGDNVKVYTDIIE